LEEQLRPISYYLKDYLIILQKRKWLIIAFFSLLLTAGTVTSLMLPTIYQTGAILLIERDNPRLMDVEEVYSVDMKWMDYHRTQYEIIRSRSLAREVITSLKLWKNPEFAVIGAPAPSVIQLIRKDIKDAMSSLTSQVTEWVKKIIGIKEEAPVEEVTAPIENTAPLPKDEMSSMRMSLLIDEYLIRLGVEPVEETRLVSVSFRGRYPKLITQIINAHAQAYIDLNIKSKYDITKTAMKAISQELEELKGRGETAQHSLQQFKEKEDIVALDSIMFSKNADQDNIIVQKISQINMSMTEAKTKRIELETVYEQLKKVINNPQEIEASPSIIQDPLIQSYKREYADLVRQYLELAERYGEKHPKMVILKSQIEEKKANIKNEAEKLIKSTETQYLTAKEKEEKLANALDEVRREAMHLNRKAIEYDSLKKDSDSSRDLYDLIQKKMKEASITSGMAATNISIVDYAEVPLDPILPKRERYIFLSAILGLMVGTGIAYLFEYLDNTIKSPHDVDRYLRPLSFLGPIGSFSTLESELITLIKPESNFSESFRNLRTNLFLNASSNGHKTFLITSPDRGEGKTLVSANLAIAMTQHNKKVLLIDANMRMPRLYSLFGMENSPGLSDLLQGNAILENIVKTTEVDGISIITAGKIPLDPLQLLNSESMVSLVEKLREGFDIVIIDAPGMSVGPDSVVVSRLVDGVLIVTQFGKTSRTIAQQAIDQLSNIQVKLSGIVINNIDYKSGRYHFPYYGWLLKEDSHIDMYMVERAVS
jgi:capsular exopolysaccharide synthesis family protein